MSDEQDRVEQFDEDVVIGDDEVWAGDEEEDYPPEHLSGVQFADADVTDESFADREAQTEPELDEVDEAAAEEP